MGNSILEPIFFLKIVSLVFLAILFLQSGLDKVFNYKGNYEWIKGHFAKSPLKNTVGIMFPMITVMEVLAGLLCAIGIIMLFINGDPEFGLYGAELSCLSILALFFGQRIAQDYAGAATLVAYFIVAMASVYLLS